MCLLPYFLKGFAFCWLGSSLALPETLSKHHIPGRQKVTSISSSRNTRSLNLSFFFSSLCFFDIWCLSEGQVIPIWFSLGMPWVPSHYHLIFSLGMYCSCVLQDSFRVGVGGWSSRSISPLRLLRLMGHECRDICLVKKHHKSMCSWCYTMTYYDKCTYKHVHTHTHFTSRFGTGCHGVARPMLTAWVTCERPLNL